MDQKLYDKGLGIRKAVLGEAYVVRAERRLDAFEDRLRRLERTSFRRP